MLLGARQFFERRGVPTPPLPYDAEVEYIETDGIASFLDTNVTVSTTAEIQMRFSLVSYPSSEMNTAVRSLCGARSGTGVSSGRRYSIAVDSSNNLFRFYNPSTDVSDSPSLDLDIHEVTFSGTLITFDGTSYSISSFTGAGSKTFCIGKDGTINVTNQLAHKRQYANARFYHLAIIDNGIKLFDGIPVRASAVGYMYDRVSRQLLGNAGTGAFLYGTDKS